MAKIFDFQNTHKRPFFCPSCGIGLEEIEEEADENYNTIGKRFQCPQCDNIVVKIYKCEETYSEEIAIEFPAEEREVFV
jgi:Zn finger protein HypA/HybF involved in hydrogenase expression